MKIEIKKVDKVRGIIQITCPDERWYTNKTRKEIDELSKISQDDFYPSVTWIGSYYPKGKEYVQWVANKGWDKAEEIKNLAGEKGTRVHRACEFLADGGTVSMELEFPDGEGSTAPLTAEEYWSVMTFGRFLEEEKPVILAMEYTILNHEHKFGGTVDVKCRIKADNYEHIWIVDIKTSKEIYPSHEIQVSSYMETDKECEKIAILQVGYRKNKNGYKFTEIEPQFDLFLAAKRIWQKEQGKVAVPQREYPIEITWEPIKEIPKVVETEK